MITKYNQETMPCASTRNESEYSAEIELNIEGVRTLYAVDLVTIDLDAFKKVTLQRVMTIQDGDNSYYIRAYINSDSVFKFAIHCESIVAINKGSWIDISSKLTESDLGFKNEIGEGFAPMDECSRDLGHGETKHDKLMADTYE